MNDNHLFEQNYILLYSPIWCKQYSESYMVSLPSSSSLDDSRPSFSNHPYYTPLPMGPQNYIQCLLRAVEILK